MKRKQIRHCSLIDGVFGDTLNDELTVDIKPVSPVVAIAANAVAFTAQQAPDKYRSGSLN